MSNVTVSPRQVYQLAILKLGLPTPLRGHQLFGYTYSKTSLEKNFQNFSLKHSLFYGSFEVRGMLIYVFHCCNIPRLLKFIAMLATYGFNSLCSSGPMHLTHLELCFTWDEVPSSRSWTFTSEEANLDVKILVQLYLLSVPTRPSILMPFICRETFPQNSQRT